MSTHQPPQLPLQLLATSSPDAAVRIAIPVDTAAHGVELIVGAYLAITRHRRLGGVPVRGYRAPTFSIGGGSKWAHAILAEEGYSYSSSVYPVKHDLYGTPDAPRTPYSPVPGMLEIPLTSVRIMGLDMPASGGGYFRLLPYPVTRGLLSYARRVNRSPAVFYLHPWEIDPEQPRQQSAPWKSRFRHYLNLDRTEPRLRRLLRNFTWTRMDRLFLSDDRGPFPAIASWTDRKPASP